MTLHLERRAFVRIPGGLPTKPGPTVHGPRRIAVGPFAVADVNETDLVGYLVAGATDNASSRPYVAYALHVGGLNAEKDLEFVAAMSRADIVYADGVSVVLVGKLGGALQLERAGTTDLGWDLLAELSRRLGRPARVGLLGGYDGLAHEAGQVLQDQAGVSVVFAEHGFHDDWTEPLDRLAEAGCDVLFVGLGAPKEMTWVDAHREELPACLVMTCGGWFGFLVEAEQRAPVWMQRSGLEWSYRLAQAPRRLAQRYGVGAVTTAKLASQVAARRLAR